MSLDICNQPLTPIHKTFFTRVTCEHIAFAEIHTMALNIYGGLRSGVERPVIATRSSVRQQVIQAGDATTATINNISCDGRLAGAVFEHPQQSSGHASLS